MTITAAKGDVLVQGGVNAGLSNAGITAGKDVRISGAADEPCTHLVLAWGSSSGLLAELAGDGEIVLTGEACEWREAEYARDASALGFKKALLVLGHCGSERDGMKYIAKLIQEKFPALEVRYFQSEEVYTYTDR